MSSSEAHAAASWLYQPVFPAQWTRSKLYDLAEWVNGLAFRDLQFTHSGKPVIKIAEIKGGISGQTKFTEQTFDDSVLVRHGDLLFSWSGQPETSIDAFWWRGREGWLNQHVFRVTPIKDVDRTFFFYVLRYLKPNFVGIARNKQTTGLGHVTKKDLQNLEVAYPKLAEQRAIAHILGTLDDKIELNRRMNETLEEMARALFKSWFVDFDPVRRKAEGRDPGLPKHLADLFPSRLVDSELGEIPEGWRVGQWRETVTLVKDSRNPGDEPATEFQHFSIPAYDEGQEPKREIGADIKSLKFVVGPGDVLLSKLNPAIERVWNVDLAPKAPAVCSTEFLVLRPRSPFHRTYVYCAARSEPFRTELKGLVTGTSNSHQRVQPETTLGLATVLPPPPSLSSFEKAAAPLLTRAHANRRESRALAETRDALLPKLISGELRVKDADRFLATVIA